MQHYIEYFRDGQHQTQYLDDRGFEEMQAEDHAGLIKIFRHAIVIEKRNGFQLRFLHIKI